MTDIAADRYAIYFFPEPTSLLAKLGQAWLGRSVEAGTDVGQPPKDLEPGVPCDVWRKVTAMPRTYGFHATLKAPFRLAAGERRETLEQAVADLASGLVPFALPPLRVTALGGFLALCLGEPSIEMGALADRCVIDLDRFRAPLTAAERSKRRPERLTARQRDHLDRWGYPYVCEDFLFHMTLTGSLPEEMRDNVAPILQRLMAPLGQTTHRVDRLSLFYQSRPGAPFVMIRQFPFQRGSE
ncbi:MAG: DUF1045 domain-containing protein [Pseudomonadota bacterium]